MEKILCGKDIFYPVDSYEKPILNKSLDLNTVESRAWMDCILTEINNHLMSSVFFVFVNFISINVEIHKKHETCVLLFIRKAE
jgi:hypothetical protein